jgi:ribosomal protein S27AE
MSRKCKAYSEFSRDNVQHQNPLSKEAFAAGGDAAMSYSPGDEEEDAPLIPIPTHIVHSRLEAICLPCAGKLNVSAYTLETPDEKVPCCECGINTIWRRSAGDRAIKYPVYITDNHGSYWSKTCPQCGQDTMEVIRPGKVQCGRCG